MNLAQCKTNQQVSIETLPTNPALSHRLRDLGLMPGALVTVLQESRTLGTLILQVDSGILAVRAQDAQQISVIGS